MNILIAFIGGIITFISPCVLPLIPIYIAYLSGVSIQDLKENKEKPSSRILLISIIFVLGFTVVFSILAALFYVFVESLGHYKIWFNRGAGALIVLFGLHTMKIIQIPFLNFEVRFQAKAGKKNFFSPLLMGMAFGAGWTPCIGPILAGILFTSSSSSGNGFQTVFLLVVYSLGLGIPFILTGLLTRELLGVFSFFKRHYKAVEIVSGLFLILLGLLLIFDWLGILSGFFSRFFPFLGEIEGSIGAVN